jgi:ribonuclease J
MKITVLDGYGTIGGNKILVEEKNEIIFLDFGMNFSMYGRYFEEFLKERSRRGIYDLWMLGLIPKMNIYRKDLITDDLIDEVSSKKRLNIKGVLVSHAHLDHVGNIALLDENIPIIASPETLLILKALADVSRGGMGMEIPFFKVRERDGYILKTGNYSQRPVFSTDRINDNARDFISKVHTKRKDVEKKELSYLEEFNTHFDIIPHRVDHSILGAVGYIIKGDLTIAYTGDFRLHGLYASYSRDFISLAKDANILITEGTRLGREEDVNLSERDVYNNALRIVEEAKGLVVADFSARNFERLQTFKEISSKTGRKLVITDRDAYHLYSLDLYDNSNRLKDLIIYDEKSSRENEWEGYLKNNIDNEWIDPFHIGKNQGDFIICFSFYDINELLDIRPVEGSVYIYSSSEAFGEEDIFSFERLMNWIDYFKMRIEGIEVINDEIIFKKGLHASGHISEDELYETIQKIDPDYIVPIHTQNVEWFRKNFPEKLREIKNNETLEI